MRSQTSPGANEYAVANCQLGMNQSTDCSFIAHFNMNQSAKINIPVTRFKIPNSDDQPQVARMGKILDSLFA